MSRKREQKWYKLPGVQTLYYGHPQLTNTVAEVFRSGKTVWLNVLCDPKTGKPWKSMREAKAWLEKK